MGSVGRAEAEAEATKGEDVELPQRYSGKEEIKIMGGEVEIKMASFSFGCFHHLCILWTQT